MGKLSGYKPRRVANCLRQKLGISFGSGGELSGWYWLDGQKRVRVVVPKVHSGDVSPRVMVRIIASLRLAKTEFRRLYDCPMTGADYESKIRELVSKDKV